MCTAMAYHDCDLGGLGHLYTSYSLILVFCLSGRWSGTYMASVGKEIERFCLTWSSKDSWEDLSDSLL